MRYLACAMVFSILAACSQAQDFKAEFEKLCETADTVKQLELLKKWEQAEPNNAELYTSYFNYYLLKSKQEVLSMSTEPAVGQNLSIQDSTGKTAGYLGSQIFYDPKTLEKGFAKIDKGISLYPNRLDIKFGKIYVLGQIEDWKEFTDEIVKTIQYSKQNNNQWRWTNNELQKEGKEVLLSSIQDYQLDLYNTGNDDLFENMRTIANEVLKYYPNHVESLSNLSITYLLTGAYDKGLESLLKAEKIAPSDAIVLSNIAQGYKLKGNKEMAIKYYEKTMKHGDEKTVEFAKQQIENLKK